MKRREYTLLPARRLAVAAGVMLAALAGAWARPARGASGPAEPPPINACALLTSGEVSALLGIPVTDGVRHDDGLTSVGAYSSTCIWKVRDARLHAHDPNASLGGADFAILNAFSWPSRVAAAGFLRSFRSAADKHEIPMRPVELHIGDESLWWGDGVAVRRGAESFGISVVVNSADRAQRRVWEEALAEKILARIPADGGKTR
jgi:hypothetical protein